ncbi:MAG: hypothetical protein KAY37_16440, partial [Phycisphaerae bacterium]|nr:hypothetical protein [Phycisphaerae bacterium]
SPAPDTSSTTSGLKIPLLAGGGLVLLIVIIVLVVSLKSAGERRSGELQLVRQVNERMDKATTCADEFNFDGARRQLAAAEDELQESPFGSVTTYETLIERIAAAKVEFAAQEADYQSKIKKGWVAFEGTMVSVSEQERILAERRRAAEAERKRKDEEWQHWCSNSRDLNELCANDSSYFDMLFFGNQLARNPFFNKMLGGRVRNEGERDLQATYRAVFAGPVEKTTGYDMSGNAIEATEGHFNILSVQYDAEAGRAEVRGVIGYLEEELVMGPVVIVPVDCTREEAETIEEDLLSGDYEMRVVFKIVKLENTGRDEDIPFAFGLRLYAGPLAVQFEEREMQDPPE